MRSYKLLSLTAFAAFGIAAYLIATAPQVHAQDSSIKIKANDIGGVVSSTKGPEAGVWVIAETTDLPTRYIKEVVTDDRGRYLIPDLPKANYTVWARGYGLVDSPKVQDRTGQDGGSEAHHRSRRQNRRARFIQPTIGMPCSRSRPRANSPARAPRATASRRTSRPRANGFTSSRPIAASPATNSATNTRARIPRMFANLGSPAKEWLRRVESGQAGHAMVGGIEPTGPAARHRRVRRLDHPHRAR